MQMNKRSTFRDVLISHQCLHLYTSDVNSRDSVLSQDSLETHFGRLGLVGWCLVLVLTSLS